MVIFSTIKETKNFLLRLKKEGKTIGFVPTMGALHAGHISLLERAKNENDIVVASIFVNPLQFNDKKDLEKYPRTLAKDAEKLKLAHCDVLFAPTSTEMYPSPPPPKKGDSALTSGSPPSGLPEAGSVALEGAFDLDNLDKVMEGQHRPGHFQGVCVVVKRLFEIIEPDKAYFGEKDFQQLTIIRHMVKTLRMPVKIVPCPTLREADGLAMSSRNTLLGPDERKNAPLIYATLQKSKEEWKNGRMGLHELKKWVENQISSNPFLKLEYFEVADSETLQPVTDHRSPDVDCRAFIAVKAGAVRLIDNIPM